MPKKNARPLSHPSIPSAATERPPRSGEVRPQSPFVVQDARLDCDRGAEQSLSRCDVGSHGVEYGIAHLLDLLSDLAR